MKPHFGAVAEYRHGAPGVDGVRDLARHRRALRDLVAAGDPANTVVHCEFSGGALVPFWSTTGLRRVRVTGTVHDGPWPVWWPLRTRGIAARTLIHHGLHYPVRPVHHLLERRAMAGRTLFALTDAGGREVTRRMPGSRIVVARHHVPLRGPIAAAEDRPAAIGLFGHVYKGKGFDKLARMRELVRPDVVIRVAGRGTEDLDPIDGVEILGGVDGPAEDAFFGSVRAIVLPYDKRSHYGEVFPASGVLMRAVAYRTPVVCSGYGALADEREDRGIVPVRGGFDELFTVADEIVHDRARLAGLRAGIDTLARTGDIEETAAVFLEEWAR
ncbi:MAG: glycosyltransferase family 1 protein [Rhodococcus sp. (in: high G+C Gram-positive bacteria)]|uniref:glycosyltransferase family 1 protein n=1 Tax=Rhodococcus sp. TaxID=1831 RepID=UPI003BB58C0F